MNENTKQSNLIKKYKKRKETVEYKTFTKSPPSMHSERQRLQDVAFKTLYPRTGNISKTLIEYTCDDCGFKSFKRKICPKCGLERI